MLGSTPNGGFGRLAVSLGLDSDADGHQFDTVSVTGNGRRCQATFSKMDSMRLPAKYKLLWGKVTIKGAPTMGNGSFNEHKFGKVHLAISTHR